MHINKISQFLNDTFVVFISYLSVNVCYFRSSFANQGEICLCTSRVFVQTGLYKEFVERFVRSARYFNAFLLNLE